jgi:hypothetical protein
VDNFGSGDAAGIVSLCPIHVSLDTDCPAQTCQHGPPAANTGKFTVRAMAEIITLWPRQE